MGKSFFSKETRDKRVANKKDPEICYDFRVFIE